MDASSFSAWLSGIGLLTADQRSSVLAELSRTAASVTAVSPPRDEGADPASDPSVPATEGLMSQIGQSRLASFGCPHCGGDSVGKWGQASGKPRYRCRDCGKTFNPLTGTPLSGLHYPDRWPDQAQALIAGETIAKAAERCRVDYTTAFRWRHRFLAALNHDKPARLSGIVEADETFILESFKGKRHGLPRASRKRGGKAGKRGLSTEQIPVLVARDRSGATIDAVLRGWTPKASRSPSATQWSGRANCAATVVPRSRPSHDRQSCGATSCQHPVVPDQMPRTCTSTTSTPITDASRNGCDASTASQP